MIVVYSSDREVLITTSENEGAFIKEWFVEGGRDLDAFDRQTGVEFQLEPKINVF